MEDLMRVLVVDDDLLNLEFMAELLRSRGYDVLTAPDGETAWALLQESHAPRMLVIDWLLPGMSGPELCRRVRAQRSTEPAYIILVTGHNPSERLHEGLAAGADDFLAKPYHPKILLSHVAVGIRQLASNRSVSTRLLRCLQEATHLGQCDVTVRAPEVSGRICFCDGAVVWADLSNDPESFYDRLLHECGGSLGRVLPLLQRDDGYVQDSSSERMAMNLAEFAELRSAVRSWVKRKVAQILRLSVIDISVIPVTRRSPFPLDIAMPLEEVLPDSLTSAAVLVETGSSSGQFSSTDGRESRPSRPPGAFNRETDDVAWRQTFPEVVSTQAPRLRELLNQLMTVRGAVGAAVLQLHQNGCLARVGRLVEISPLLGALHVVKELYVPGQEIGSATDATPELIVTSSAEHHLLHVVPGSAPIAILLVLNAKTSTLAMARHQVQQAARSLLLPAGPALRDSDMESLQSGFEPSTSAEANRGVSGG
ncbi:MAG TPA: response regulator [Pseudomonadota bacterium]|nr:response regulator [Pseudomonadota bacterium]